MRGKLTLLALLLGLIIIFGDSVNPSSAQGTATPTPSITPTLPTDDLSKLPTITALNADRLTQIAALSPGNVSGATWSPDGTTLAVYGEKGIWLYALSNLIAPRFFESDFVIFDVIFSPDGKYLASQGSWELNAPNVAYTQYVTGVQLWDISKIVMEQLLPNVDSPIFTSDSSTLIVQDSDVGAPRLLFWDIAKGEYRAVLPNVYASLASPAGNAVACVRQNQDISVVSICSGQTGQIVRVLDEHSQPVKAMAFDPSGKLLAAVGKYGIMKVWDVSSGELQRILGEDLSFIRDRPLDFTISFSFDGTLIGLVAIPLGRQAGANIWITANGREVARFVTDYGSSIYFDNTTIIVIDDTRGDATYFRGNVDSQRLVDIAFPKFNPARSLIVFLSYLNNGVVLYGVR